MAPKRKETSQQTIDKMSEAIGKLELQMATLLDKRAQLNDRLATASTDEGKKELDEKLLQLDERIEQLNHQLVNQVAIRDRCAAAAVAPVIDSEEVGTSEARGGPAETRDVPQRVNSSGSGGNGDNEEDSDIEDCSEQEEDDLPEYDGLDRFYPNINVRVHDMSESFPLTTIFPGLSADQMATVQNYVKSILDAEILQTGTRDNLKEQWGYLDRPVVYTTVLGSPKPTPKLVLRSIDFKPFLPVPSKPLFNETFVLLELLSSLYGYRDEDRFVYVMGEILAMQLPADTFKSCAQARRDVIDAVVKKLTSDPTAFDVPGTTSTSGIVASSSSEEAVPNIETAIMLVLIRAKNRSKSASLLEDWRSDYIGAFVSYCKRGQLNNHQIGKIREGVRDDLGWTIRIESRAVQEGWKMWSRYMDSKIAADTFVRWSALVPGETAMRLSLTVRQASGSGLTNYIMVLEAMSLFPEFPWHQIAGIIPGDWAGIQEASRLIAGNPYYGFNPKLGKAASAYYKSLGYVAWRILKEIAGKTTLEQYNGVTRAPSRKMEIDAVIDRFKANIDTIARAEVAPEEWTRTFASLLEDNKLLIN